MTSTSNSTVNRIRPSVHVGGFGASRHVDGRHRLSSLNRALVLWCPKFASHFYSTFWSNKILYIATFDSTIDFDRYWTSMLDLMGLLGRVFCFGLP